MHSILSLYHIVRRPTHILDFSLTLVFIHLILTIYYSSSFPTSFFFWFIVAGSSVAQIVLAEQLCVKREMRDGFTMNDVVTPFIGATPMPMSDGHELSPVRDRDGGKNGGGDYSRVPASESLA